ncbi:MAG: VCBS repeat-containing protein [Bacteroidales bacterium]|nr:VCBS repeat-containing protein [Bacteroidales bacterium]
MDKKYLLLVLFLLTFGITKAQIFTKIPTQFTGVMDPVETWIIAQNGPSYAYVAGERYQDTRHSVFSQLEKNNVSRNFVQVYSPFPALYHGDAAAGDYNGDGRPDVVVTGLNQYGVPVMKLYRNNGNGKFTEVVNPDFIGLSGGSVAWGDYDKDGDLDILETGKDARNRLATYIYRNDKGVFHRILTRIPGVVNGAARWGDFNSDGYPDMVIMGNDGNGAVSALYKNEQGKSFSFVRNFDPLQNGDVACADFDGDGDVDIFMTGEDSNGVPQCHMYSNETGFRFREVSVPIRPLKNGNIDVADMDHDGDLDIVITGESMERPYTLVYENKLAFSFKQVMAGLPGVTNGKALWGDFDHDGDQDLLLTGIDVCYGFHAAIYRNNINPPKNPVESDNSIFINAPLPNYKTGPFYYYVVASCYCDPEGTGHPQYHMYISNVHRELKKYNLTYRFDAMLIKIIPNWGKTDAGHRTSNGFLTKEQAEASRKQMIESYIESGFKVHYLNW